FHTFMGEKIKDWKSCRDLVKSIFENYRIPYLTISPTYSICPIHGYIAGEHFECPKCKAEKEKQLKQKIAQLEAEKAELTKK
ncbi:MAG TPA: ribonucleoside triphosphate reductase, partial [Treponema sp.]|nr:ribonucleoside triphosphate reductase [Treponema sp.]